MYLFLLSLLLLRAVSLGGASHRLSISHQPLLVSLNLYLSEHLWLAGDYDGAFAVLDRALEHAKKYENIWEQVEFVYTAPLLSMITIKLNTDSKPAIAANLSEDWP